MTTLTATKARTRLAYWLKRAAAGENIGIQCGEGVIALRPMTTLGRRRPYAQNEYGATSRELADFARRVKAEVVNDRRQGRMKRYLGDFHAAISD
jgi:antitoxin (DNA-binding transcriptional repressor) of toxin-antitoxin stability system